MKFAVVSYTENFMLIIHGYQVLVACIGGVCRRFKCQNFIIWFYSRAAFANVGPFFTGSNIRTARLYRFSCTDQFGQRAKIHTVDNCAVFRGLVGFCMRWEG
ncbi:hypothetical protein C035_01987 [Brucella melitensis R3/07-2]|nr:hypothetical protein DK62_1189 [Brucella melitensis bv. 3 str. Ether]ENQ91627.1 hypothetical protein C061_00312 [Brucella melitensis F5/07-239A]ENQ94531.1 hypothetical protein C035_01987 [Brucella melitensis R3/07-2]ENT72048.1 hypothetical protein D628_01542 [Brucella melitensis F15/06-7]SPU56802.1 Uncharacterised protein [Brucella melitensis]